MRVYAECIFFLINFTRINFVIYTLEKNSYVILNKLFYSNLFIFSSEIRIKMMSYKIYI